ASPMDFMNQSGADILRVWVVSSNYTEDLRIGAAILKHQTDLYRRVRNTLRFILGNLNGFEESERLAQEEMPELERWVLHRLWEMDRLVRKAVEDFDFHGMWTALHNFCAIDLSAFYFDMRKDTLYCDGLTDKKRRACRTVLDEVFSCLTSWLAPILCFTAEEAWLERTGDDPENSVHLRVYPEIPEAWRNDDLAEKWEIVRRVRRVVTGALEIERAEKRIGSSLQAAPLLILDKETQAVLADVDMAEVSITSALSVEVGEVPAGAFRLDEVPGVGVVPALAKGEKCVRCFQVREDVSGEGICGRCTDVVADWTPASTPVD
ncbi:MAG: class I tRNA ligase family protein, partial [Alphaproteobacteria bacterium]